MAANDTTLTQAMIDRGAAPVALRGGANVGETERWASMIGGGALALYGLTRGSLGGVTLALVGGALLYRGVSGHCDLYEALGFNTAERADANPNVSVQGGHGIKVEQSTMINKSPAELYRFWRNFENLPRFMRHVEEVRVSDPRNSHWIVRGPAGTSVEWDAEVYNETENELIAWPTPARFTSSLRRTGAAQKCASC